ncbi:hypothetical protein [Cellulomonas sp. URHB0016]
MERAEVSVYEVDATGGTGRYIGAGSLIHPLVVRLEEPAGAELARQDRSGLQLRVEIPSSGSDGTVDIVEAVAVHVTDGEEDGDFVALSLPRPTGRPVVDDGVTDSTPPIDPPGAPDAHPGDGLIAGTTFITFGCRWNPPPWCVPRGRPDRGDISRARAGRVG